MPIYFISETIPYVTHQNHASSISTFFTLSKWCTIIIITNLTQSTYKKIIIKVMRFYNFAIDNNNNLVKTI